MYPEVKNDAFEADIVFDGAAPGLKRGQTVTVELSFGASSQTLIVEGGFIQQTGGRWVYLIAEDGSSARRVTCGSAGRIRARSKCSRASTEGDRIVTSGYDTYNNVDELRIQRSNQSQPRKRT